MTTNSTSPVENTNVDQESLEKKHIVSPGIYRLSELEEILGRTRKTIERYIDRFSLKTDKQLYNGREVLVVELDAESAGTISATIDTTRCTNSSSIGNNLESNMTTNGSKKSPNEDITSKNAPKISKKSHEKSPSLEIPENSTSLLEQLKKDLIDENVKLKTQQESFQQILNTKDETIRAKDEVIESLKTSMVILERNNKELVQKQQHLMLEANKEKNVPTQEREDGWYILKKICSFGFYK